MKLDKRSAQIIAQMTKIAIQTSMKSIWGKYFPIPTDRPVSLYEIVKTKDKKGWNICDYIFKHDDFGMKLCTIEGDGYKFSFPAANIFFMLYSFCRELDYSTSNIPKFQFFNDWDVRYEYIKANRAAA